MTIANFEQNTKTSNYKINFRRNVEQITQMNYKDGIKLLTPLYINEFPNDMIKHKCLCGHIIHKIMFFEYDGGLYKIGCDCINKLSDDLTDKQKEKINKVFDDYKQLLKDMKNDYKAIVKDYTNILDEYEKSYEQIINTFNKQKNYIIKKEQNFLNKERAWKEKKYTFRFLIDNINNEEYKRILTWYFFKFPFDDNQKSYFEYIVKSHIKKNKK